MPLATAVPAALDVPDLPSLARSPHSSRKLAGADDKLEMVRAFRALTKLEFNGQCGCYLQWFGPAGSEFPFLSVCFLPSSSFQGPGRGQQVTPSQTNSSNPEKCARVCVLGENSRDSQFLQTQIK